MEAKDIIFYSNFCTFSKDVINRISKTPINDNMVYICVDDRNIKLPPFVQSVPTIYLTKEKKIIVDDNIDSWIQSKTQTAKISNAEIDSYQNGFGGFSSNFSNIGNEEDNSFSSNFTYLDQSYKIETPTEGSSGKRDIGKSYEELEQSRRSEFSNNNNNNAIRI
jgi:hypothetical protein